MFSGLNQCQSKQGSEKSGRVVVRWSRSNTCGWLSFQQASHGKASAPLIVYNRLGSGHGLGIGNIRPEKKNVKRGSLGANISTHYQKMTTKPINLVSGNLSTRTMIQERVGHWNQFEKLENGSWSSRQIRASAVF